MNRHPPRILILGGTGHTGKLIARHLLEQSDAFVTLAARRVDRARTVADELNRQKAGPRVAVVHADAADAASLRAALRGQDLMVVAAPVTAHAEVVVRAAMEAGVDYLDVQLSARKLALLQSLASDIKSAGRCFITEAGFHPGLPSALVRHAAAHLDTIESATVVGYLNMGKDLPYSDAVDELIEVFKDYQAQVYKDGRWTEAHSFATRRIDLGGDIGPKRCYSMFFEELRLLPDIYPSLQDLGFFMSESHWVTDWVVMPIAWMWLKVRPGAVRSIGRFLWWGMGNFHRQPYRVEVQVQASGRRNGRRTDMRTTVAHPDGYELTAIPVVAALLQYMDGSAREPGLWLMGHLVEPIRLMRDMEAMGVAFTSTVQ